MKQGLIKVAAQGNITFVAIAGNSCFENILVATRVLFTTSYELGF